MRVKSPELLAPAGNLEKLKIAFRYGADAVYVGTAQFGLRKYADNFSLIELAEGIALANRLGKQVYVVLNGFAHTQDLDPLATYLNELQTLQPHGLIISDMGVFQLAKRLTTIPLHVSTQASVTNSYAVRYWKEAGAKRVILAREVSLADCETFLNDVDVELEIFVHGAMCASYSGKCVISNYSSGRDSNRGGCVQSCRHAYDITYEDGARATTHIMNAKDLMAVAAIPDCVRIGIASLKIEGRMKSNLYVANAVLVYRRAIDAAVAGEPLDIKTLETQLALVSNRGFSDGGLSHRPHGESVHYPTSACSRSVDFIGTIQAQIDAQFVVMQVNHPFQVGQTLHFLQPGGPPQAWVSENITDLTGAPLTQIKPNSLVKLPWQPAFLAQTVIFK